MQRSERSVRRYLHQGRLRADRVDMAAGGWHWLIDKDSVESLRERLQAGQQGAALHGVDELTAEVQALRGLVEGQTEEIARLREAVAGLLPPGREESKPGRWRWPWNRTGAPRSES